MRLVLLRALLASILAPGSAFCQHPMRAADSRPVEGPALSSQSSPSTARADEIKQLKEAVGRLQQQIDRLSAVPDATTAPPPPREFITVAPVVQPAPIVNLFTNPSFPVAAAGKKLKPDGQNRAEKKEQDKEDEEDPLKMSAEWKNGLVIESKDKDFQAHLGGSLQFDAAWNAASQAVQFGPGGTGELGDGALFRRARIRFDGTMYQHIEWVAEFDFANDVENDTSSSSQPIGSPSFTNVWIGINDLPLFGTLRAGWMKEPIGFAHLESSRWYNFMELSPGIGSLNLRSPGLLFLNTSADERVTWAAGVFHVQNDNFGFGFGDAAGGLILRGHASPWTFRRFATSPIRVDAREPRATPGEWGGTTT
jgi:hypothetical protein